MEKYEIRDLGDLTWFLKMRVTRGRPNRKVWITLDAYIDKTENSASVTVLSFNATGVDLFYPYEGKATREEIEAVLDALYIQVHELVLTLPKPLISFHASCRTPRLFTPNKLTALSATFAIHTKDLSIQSDSRPTGKQEYSLPTC
jgi:hypothetical protein